MSLPLLKPLLLTVGATSLVFFGGVIALSAQSPDADNMLSAANSISQNTDISQKNDNSSSLSSSKAVANPLTQPQATQPSSLATITAAQATALAKQDAPDAILQATPELINYNGTAAYEVLLDSGTTYVDANFGAILNSVASPVVTSDHRAESHDDDDDNDNGDHKDKHHDDDKYKEDKHRSKKYDDKRDKENSRLIATSYQQHDEDGFDEDNYDD